ncbi:Syntaxin-6, partial [Nowakowskiella sp. JEL0078]
MSLASASQLYQTWCRLVDSNSPLSASTVSSGATVIETEELKWTSQELKNSLQTIELDLQDLEETIKIVEANPNRFRLDESEILGRRDFISKTRKSVLDMKTTVGNPTANKSRESVQRNALLSPIRNKVTESSSIKKPISASNFVENEQHTQAMIMRQQDDQLDGVLNTVHGLKEVAHVMGRELDDQTHLLGDLENQVDTTQGKLQLGIKRLREIIKTNA